MSWTCPYQIEDFCKRLGKRCVPGIKGCILDRKTVFIDVGKGGENMGERKEATKMAKLDVITEFREDHRKVRDGLLDIIDALKAKDVAKARGILGNLNTLVGPHFRYEEETLYPALKVFLGEYVDQLLSEHDGVIDTAKTCAALLEKDTLTDEEAKQAAEAARKLLVHVSNCDGLAILSERFEPKELEELADRFIAARKAGVSLLDWAEKIRKK